MSLKHRAPPATKMATKAVGVLLAFAWHVHAEPNTRMCIKNTGGSCTVSDCYKWREATGGVGCDAGRCFCDDTSCSGIDGGCYSEDNKYIVLGASNTSTETTWYTFTNARWPDVILRTASLSTNANLYATGGIEDESRFSLVMPPLGQGGEPSFLMYSKKWPDAVVQIADTGEKGAAKYAPSCSYIVNSVGASWPLPNIMMSLVVAPSAAADGTQLVMLKAYWAQQYIYVGQGTTSIVSLPALGQDPGAGGYWMVNPRLPANIVKALPKFNGVRCSSMCGEISKALTMTNVNAAARASLEGVVIAAILAVLASMRA
mmetsp:Transcript_120751/g.385526  ORF Transcript_120751/g.385526 Transcript_120751/m.385526 type:complete len:316 (-) Transcript_120751:160-1107(-)